MPQVLGREVETNPEILSRATILLLLEEGEKFPRTLEVRPFFQKVWSNVLNNDVLLTELVTLIWKNFSKFPTFRTFLELRHLEAKSIKDTMDSMNFKGSTESFLRRVALEKSRAYSDLCILEEDCRITLRSFCVPLPAELDVLHGHLEERPADLARQMEEARARVQRIEEELATVANDLPGQKETLERKKADVEKFLRDEGFNVSKTQGAIRGQQAQAVQRVQQRTFPHLNYHNFERGSSLLKFHEGIGAYAPSHGMNQEELLEAINRFQGVKGKMPARLSNALARAGIMTLKDLQWVLEEEIKIERIGGTGIKECWTLVRQPQ